MYGDGFTSRSTRYTANGSTGSTRSKRCASTTWKMSPSRMCSFAASTAAVHCASLRFVAHLGQLGELVGRRQRGHVRQRAAEIGDRVGEPRDRGVVVAAAASRRRSPAAGYTFSIRKQRWRKWSNAATWPASEHTASGKPEIVVRNVGQPLDLAHGVVADPADDAAVERRELGLLRARGTASAARRARRAFPVGGDARRAAMPPIHSRLPAAGDERERGIAARGTRSGPSVRRARPTRAGSPRGRRRASRTPRAASRDRRAPRATPARRCTRAPARRTSRTTG